MGWFQPKLGYLSSATSTHLPFVTYNASMSTISPDKAHQHNCYYMNIAT